MTVSGRRIRIDLAYDGTAYHGWQVQPGVGTVQGIVEEALGRVLGGVAVRVRGAGRTDAGVHARMQVADAWIEARIDDRAIGRALAGMLPADVRPRSVRTVPPEFDARRSALWKTYVYRLDLSPHGDPFASRFALHHPHALDRDAMRDALARLPGRRDWSGFASAACEVEDRVRHLMDARWLEDGEGGGAFVFRADGFLTHMVRNLVGTLLEIARGRFVPDRIDAVLAAGDRRLAGATAAPRGLCLHRVDYGGGDSRDAEDVPRAVTMGGPEQGTWEEGT